MAPRFAGPGISAGGESTLVDAAIRKAFDHNSKLVRDVEDFLVTCYRASGGAALSP